MSSRHSLTAAFGAALFVLVGPAVGQTAQNTLIRLLDTIPAKDGGVSYSVTPGSDLVLPFSVDKGGKLELYLSPFRGEHGDSVSIKFSIDGLADVEDQRPVFSATVGRSSSIPTGG